MWIQTIILSVLLEIVLSQRTPTISRISQDQVIDIGGSIDLDCSVNYADGYPVLWLKHKNDYVTPLTNNANMIYRDSRYSIRHDKASSTYTLQIKDIQEQDAAEYECRILIESVTPPTGKVKLNIRQAPFISDNSTRSIIANEGETHELRCSAGGFPPPTITWRREDNAILPTGGATYKGPVLKINSVRKEDRGTYYCVAENGVIGTNSRRNINVEVEFAPVVTIPRPRMGQALQYDMDLECHVEAYPPPSITWYKDGTLLSTNQHYSISHFATADEYTDSTLRVITIEKRQYGEFTCRATNKHGSDEKKVELFETVIPICPPACGTNRYNGVMPITPGPLVVITLAIITLFKNINTKY